MSERDTNNRIDRFLDGTNKWLARGAIGALALAIPSSISVADMSHAKGIEPGNSEPKATAVPFPTVEITPTVAPSVDTTPEVKEKKSRGKRPVKLSWRFSGFSIEDVYVEKVGLDNNGNVGTPKGHFNAAWYSGGPGVCQTNGNDIVTAHSAMDNNDGSRALIKTNFPQLAEKHAVGSVIETTTANGTGCYYQVEWVETVDKFGKGPGTYGYLVTHNPTGRHLYDQEGEPGFVFVSCDETQGWNYEKGTSNASTVVYAKRVYPEKTDVEKDAVEKEVNMRLQRALARASIE